MDQSNQLDLVWIFNVLWRRKWLILGLTLLAVVVSIVLVNNLPPVYKATATIMIERSESGSISELNTLMAEERLALTYSQIITSQPILEKVITKLNLATSTNDLADNITVTPIQDTQLVRITATDASSYQASMTANAIAEIFIEHIDSLQANNLANAVDNVQRSIEDKQAEIDNIMPEIDVQNLQNAHLETEISRLNSLVLENRTVYHTLEQSAQSLELTIIQNAHKIRIIETAHLNTPTSPPPYVASIMLFIDQDIIIGNSNYTGRISDLVFQIYGPILERDELLEEVIEQLNLDISLQALRDRVSYAAVPNTQLLELRVSDNDSAQAIRIASTIADIYIAQNKKILARPYQDRLDDLETDMNDLDTQLLELQNVININNSKIIPVKLELGRLENELTSKYQDLRELQNFRDEYLLEAERSANTIFISEPATPAEKESGHKILYVFISVLVALALSCGLAFILENLGDKIRSQQDVSAILGQKPVGIIGHIEKGKNKLIYKPDSSPYIAEDFRKLGAIIQPAIAEIPIQKLLITSPHPDEGKSLVAANLAIVLAKTGTRVALLEADLHRPQLSILFNVDTSNGLSDFLSSRRKTAHLKPTDYKNLKILTSGDATKSKNELINSPRLGMIFKALEEQADMVLIDCPPVLSLADAAILMPLVDGILLVVKSGRTERRSVVEAMSILKMVKIPILGVVLNDVKKRQNKYYEYYKQENKKPIVEQER